MMLILVEVMKSRWYIDEFQVIESSNVVNTGSCVKDSVLFLLLLYHWQHLYISALPKAHLLLGGQFGYLSPRAKLHPTTPIGYLHQFGYTKQAGGLELNTLHFRSLC